MFCCVHTFKLDLIPRLVLWRELVMMMIFCIYYRFTWQQRDEQRAEMQLGKKKSSDKQWLDDRLSLNTYGIQLVSLWWKHLPVSLAFTDFFYVESYKTWLCFVSSCSATVQSHLAYRMKYMHTRACILLDFRQKIGLFSLSLKSRLKEFFSIQYHVLVDGHTIYNRIW